MMETKELEKHWHLIRNDNGEWISDENIVILTKVQARSLRIWARLKGKKISIQHGYEGILWCYKHEFETIKKAMNKNENTYQGRGLHSPKLRLELCKDGLLLPLLEIVRSDKDLVLEITISIYTIKEGIC